jgi:outer membrane protein assembly factor BamB
LWEFSYPSSYVDPYGYNRGPRCSPVVDGQRVYVYGVEGQLHCLNVTDGSLVWKCDTAKQFDVVQNFFGVGSTPVIYQDVLVTMVGGSPPNDQGTPPDRLDRVGANGSGIVAFDKLTGRVRYQVCDELASYASPRVVQHSGRPWCFMLLRGGLVGFHPGSGVVDFHFPWRANLLESVNASTPVVVENRVLISETYGPGSALLEFQPGSVRVVWSDQKKGRQKSLQTHWNTPIYHEGYVYGSSGRHSYQAELRCVQWETGKLMWSQPGLTRSSLLYVDGHFVCLGEDGTLRLIRATPERFEQVAEARPVGRQHGSLGESPTQLLEYPAWAAPILSHGLLYARGRDRVACFELIPDEE